MARPAVRVRGLDDFRRELRRMDRQYGKELGDINLKVAEFVIDKANQKGRRLGGVHAHVVRNNAFRASRRQKAATVNVGGAGGKAPTLGAEFGAKQYRQFPEWLGNQWSPDGSANVGYMLHPAIRENVDEWLDMYWDELNRLARRAFPD